MVQIKPANIWIFYFRAARERERIRFQGRFVTYSLAGEFNSFRYKYISSGRSWEITFAGIMAKNTKTSAEITRACGVGARGPIEFCAWPRVEL